MNSKLENDLMIMMLFSYSDLCSSQQTNNIVSVRDREAGHILESLYTVN